MKARRPKNLVDEKNFFSSVWSIQGDQKFPKSTISNFPFFDKLEIIFGKVNFVVDFSNIKMRLFSASTPAHIHVSGWVIGGWLQIMALFVKALLEKLLRLNPKRTGFESSQFLRSSDHYKTDMIFICLS